MGSTWVSPRAYSPASGNPSARLLKLYFGGAPDVEKTSPPIYSPRLITQAVNWFHQHIEPIEPLQFDDRRQHRAHLRIIGEILGLLPAVNAASKARQQYMVTFNAVKTKACPPKGKEEPYRMRYHHNDQKQNVSQLTPNPFEIQQHGFYILVFSPNGAIESFRRNTPPQVAVTKDPPTDWKQRGQLFSATRQDFEQLQRFLTPVKPKLKQGLAYLSTSERYSRSIFKPGQDQKDAWQNPYSPPKELLSRKHDFQTWFNGEKSS